VNPHPHRLLHPARPRSLPRLIWLAALLLALALGSAARPATLGHAQISPPSPGDFNLLDVLNKLSASSIQQALAQYPVPFAIITRSSNPSAPGGVVEQITAFKAGSPKQIDVDNNGATGQGGHDIQVLVEQLLGPPFQLRLTITALPDSKGNIAPDLTAIIAFPMDPFNSESLAAPPYLFWGYDTRANPAPESKFIPASEQLVFTPNVFGGTVHSLGMALTSSGTPDSVKFLGGLYQNQLALNPPPPGASILDLNDSGLRLTPVPATASLTLDTSELLGAPANASQVALTWAASSPTKAELTFDEGVGASGSPSATFTDTITVDQMPTSEALSINLNLGASPPTFSVHHAGNSVINSVVVDRTESTGTREQKFTFTGVPLTADLALQANKLSATFGPASGAQNTPTLGSAVIDLIDGSPGGLFGLNMKRAEAKLLSVPDFSINWNNSTTLPTVSAGVTKPGDFIGFVGVAMAAKDTFPAIWTANPMSDGPTTLDHVVAFEDDTAGFRWALGFAKLQSVTLNLNTADPTTAFQIGLAAANHMTLRLAINAGATVLPHSMGDVNINCQIHDVPRSMNLTGTNFRDQWQYTASDPIASITCSIQIGTLTCSLAIGSLPKAMKIDYAAAGHFNLTITDPVGGKLGLYQLICDDTTNGLAGTDGFFGVRLKHARVRVEQAPSLTSSWSYGSAYAINVDALGSTIGSIEAAGALVDISPPAIATAGSDYANLVDQGTSGPEKKFGFRVLDLGKLSFSDGNSGGVSFNYQTAAAHPLYAVWNTDITSTLTGPNLGLNATLSLLNLPASVNFSSDFSTQLSLTASGGLNEIDVTADITQTGGFVTHVVGQITGVPTSVTYSFTPAVEGSASLTLSNPITHVMVELTSNQGILKGEYKHILLDVQNIPANWNAAWGIAPSPHATLTAGAALGTVAIIVSRDVKSNTPSNYSPFTAAGGSIQYSAFARTIDQRYFDQGVGGAAVRDPIFMGRLDNLYNSTTQLAPNEDHLIYRRNGAGQLDFLSVRFTGFKAASLSVDPVNLKALAHVEIPSAAAHPFYLALENTAGTFLTVNVPNIPSTMDADVDLGSTSSGHANVDFSASPGTITIYQGPLPGASDGQKALKVILTNTPTSVHASYNIGFPGNIALTTSNPVEIALLTQDNGGRFVADFVAPSMSANWGFSTGDTDTKCQGIPPECGVFYIVATAFFDFEAASPIDGFLTSYDFIGSPASLNPAGPAPNANEYVPRVSVIANDFTHFKASAGVEICLVGICPTLVPQPFINIDTDLLGSFDFDYWDLGGGFLNFLGHADYIDNNPWHFWPLLHDPNDHYLPFN